MVTNVTGILNVSNQNLGKQQEWLKKLETVTLECIDYRTPSVLQLAKAMNISERTLHYKLKKTTGFTPAKYIREQRLLQAKQLLENRTYSSVSEVSFRVGFQKPSYFSLLFKKRFGSVPSRYLQF